MEVKGEKNVGIDIVQVSFPPNPPEKNVEKYFESKLQNERFFNYPNWDVARSGPAMRLVTSRRSLKIAEDNLAAKREEYVKKRIILDNEWKDLELKEQYLRNNFILFHKFVKENSEKKERAARRLNEEYWKYENRIDEIMNMKTKIRRMTIVRNSLEANVRDLTIFEDYLNQVVADASEFSSILSILSRFDALDCARTELVTRQNEDMEDLEHKRTLLMKLIEDRTQAFMGLNNRLADLQLRYQKAKNEALHWENVVYKVKNKSSKELLKFYLVRDSINNLYIQMCNRKGVVTTIPKQNLEEQLLYIKATIIEYKKIIRIAEKKTQRDMGTVVTNSDRTDRS